MEDTQPLEALFREHGYDDFKWIDPKAIIVAQWVRMKCTFGCDSYGRNASCPPNTPPVPECRQFFDEYGTAAVFHFHEVVPKRDDRHRWTVEVNRGLVELERAVFLAGFEKAFLLFMDCCRLCRKCAEVRAECKEPELARPTPEGMAMDVFSTVRKYGYPIEVLRDYAQPMNRYAFLLVE